MTPSPPDRGSRRAAAPAALRALGTPARLPLERRWRLAVHAGDLLLRAVTGRAPVPGDAPPCGDPDHVLAALAEALAAASDAPTVAERLARTVGDAVGAPRVLVLAGPEGQLARLGGAGPVPPAVARGRGPRPAVVERAHGQAGPVTVRDPAADPWLAGVLPGAGAVTVVPVRAGDRALGVALVEHGRHDPDVALAQRCASYAGVLLRALWQLERVERLAATDGLTKIANRRTFEQTLERELARATRSAEPVSLVLVDIDHFKRLNDDHGHQAGDEVLRNVAAALSCECRDFDTAARYGGEEFAVVLPGCGPEEAGHIAERLRRAVSAAPAVVRVTASAGVASFPAHAVDADALVRAADVALYASKHGGRDRTTVSTGAPPPPQDEALLRRAVTARLGLAGTGLADAEASG